MKQLRPFVSVCTPTYNRRPFLPIMFQCFRNQTYPADRLEWIIIDDGTDCVRDVIESAGIPQIRYFYQPQKMVLGEKRNYMHSKCTGDILVYMDDDDYYPPERISHAVDMLEANPSILCAGSSEMYVYFGGAMNKMYQFGPYHMNHACAATFAFRKELLNMTHYKDTQALAEEKEFLKNYQIPLVQLNPLKTILVFSHNHNTFDKKKALPGSSNQQQEFVRESIKTIDDFIRQDFEKPIRHFFINVDTILKNYTLGETKHKPDVLEQIKNLEKERAQLMAAGPPLPSTPEEWMALVQRQVQIIQQQNFVIQELQQNKIAVSRNPNEPPMILTHAQVLEFIKQQQKLIELLKARIAGGA